jgi:NAD(P)-dependent dehydrogenase (short-subunit alcohol dehydrogenase family)
VAADIVDTAAEVVAAVESRGRRALYVRSDASSKDDNEALAARAVEAFGGIDVLVTAAGISHAGYRSGDVEGDMQRLLEAGALEEPTRQLVDLSIADWQRVLDVNLTGTLLAVQAVARRMLEQGRGGSIVTIASIAAKHPEAGPLAYGVSKAGVWMLTKQIARTPGPAGIRVNAIGPGYIDTNMTAIIQAVPDVRDQLMAAIPLGRMGSAREVADAALFLASDESSYFTGEILHPDGGFYTD